MKMKRSFFATVAAVTLAVLGPGVLPSAAAGETDWIATDGALVNRLGGVHVYGTVSCAGTAQTLREAGSFVYQGEDGAEEEILIGADDAINLFVNPDNYVVSQPAGRRQMVTVEHGSSQMSPCYVETETGDDGITPWAELGVECAADGDSCTWRTHRFAYDPSPWVPLFDYSTDGKFKAGDLNVYVSTYGVLIGVVRADGSWEYYSTMGYVDVFGQQVVRAKLYR